MTMERVAVIGAGTMGAALAGLIANAGMECLLLDNLPAGIGEADAKRGWTENSPVWRNRIASRALEGLLKSRPPALYAKKLASLIKPGNMADHLEWLAEVDWVIEAVFEDMAVKRELFLKAAGVVKPECVLSTNTSGLSVEEISAPLGYEAKRNFLGIHFFNPPRYMKLVEIIPGAATDNKITQQMVRFCEERLGKSALICRDTPGFIANRIGSFDMATAVRLTVEKGLPIHAADAVAACLGRPVSGIFGTLDIVGLDVARHVAAGLQKRLAHEDRGEGFAFPAFIHEMVEKKWLGNKSGRGFYQKTRNREGGAARLSLNYKTMEYGPPDDCGYPTLEKAKKAGDDAALAARILFAGDDGAAEFAREYLCRTFLYAAERLTTAGDDCASIDRALRWGYNHRLGPFELWDGLGLGETLPVMKELGLTVPEKIEAMLDAGHASFYRTGGEGLLVYDFAKKNYAPLEEPSGVLSLAPLKGRGKTLRESPGASLVDLGDGAACLEFHTKMNTIDDDVMQMILDSCQIVEENFLGLIVGNEGPHFSAGANIEKLLSLCLEGNWDFIDRMVALFQEVNMRIKYLSRPVLAAPAGLSLGGGCELSMHAAACLPAAETYMGLVETAVGLLPAGGGCKELMLRITEGIPEGLVEEGLNLQHFYLRAFETITRARVSTSAVEAVELGYIRKGGEICVRRDRHIAEAKRLLLSMAHSYRKPRPALIPVMGENFRGLTEALLYNMREGSYISGHDLCVAGKLAHVLSGGDCGEGTCVTEQEILDREREAFLSLCGEDKTQARIKHMLETGRPLRN